MILLLVVASVHPGAQEIPGVRFSWALLCRDPEGQAIEVDYDAHILHLASGATFRFLIKPLSVCYTYLYLDDAQGDLYPCFPESFSAWDAVNAVDRRNAIPGGDGWYRLDERGGTEVFYLIVSRYRLTELEARTLAYLGGGAKGRRAARRRVLDGIRSLITDNSPLAAVVAEKQTVVAGDFRGVEEEEVAGNFIEAGEVYVTTIRFGH